MYKLHLILKYLRKRRIAWVSLVAVTLCTAMVLIVISIMGGWLRMFLDTTHALEGDVIIYRHSVTGFGHYDEIMDAVRKLPQVKAATSMISTLALANIDGQEQVAVQVRAYGNLDQVGQVNSFQKGLWRQYQQPMEAIKNDPALSPQEKAQRLAALAAAGPSFDKPLDAETYRNELPGAPGANYHAENLPGIIVSTPLIRDREADGSYTHPSFIYQAWIQLTFLDISSINGNAINAPSARYWIVDDVRTGLYPVDVNTVYVPFDKLQKDLGMGAQYAPDGSVAEPGHVSEIQVALKDGADLYQATAAIQQAVDNVQTKYPFSSDPLRVESWDEHEAEYTSAIIHEKVLLTFLFGIISVVAVFLVFCIFYMIVAEKTRDIGIIKSVGASNAGVAQIFLGYGLSIGLLGAGMGLLAAYLIVHNINALHAWMGRELGVKIWDPKTYIFDTIPNTMQANDVIWIVSVAVLSALVGAMVPAIRASRMNPVEALRWE